MVGKVLKMLARGGLLESRRGSHGGYALALPPDRITIAGIVQVLEGPIGLTDCSPGRDRSCDYEEHCPVRGPVIRLNAVIRQALEDVTLAQIVSQGRAAPRPRDPERRIQVRA
jgi:Rrf2 family protein